MDKILFKNIFYIFIAQNKINIPDSNPEKIEIKIINLFFFNFTLTSIYPYLFP